MSDPVTAPKQMFVRHWRMLWTPWFVIDVGRHNGKHSVWLETRGGVTFFDLWMEKA